MSERRISLDRAHILAHRRRVGALDERVPPGDESLRRAAWAGLQDSMPRAALLSIHARVERTAPAALDDPALVQVWGPRYSTYVIAAADRAVFTLGRLPEDARGRTGAEETATRLDAFLAGRTMGDREAATALGVHPNWFRYGAPTGRILIRWEGARQPLIWTVHAPPVDPSEARLELARRYLHVFGPADEESFATWAEVSSISARSAFETLRAELLPVRTPIGPRWMLAADEDGFRARPDPAAAARLLPSGDASYLLHGLDRELLVSDRDRRALLWTSRVWPGAVLVGGEVVGTWRRSQALVSIEAWGALTDDQRTAVEAEAATMPLPGLSKPIRVAWVT